MEKESLKFYPSIESIYKRDPETNKLRIGVVRDPVWENVAYWRLTEKIDGTNTSFVYTEESDDVEIRGRTERAQWNASHLKTLEGIAPSKAKVWEVLSPRLGTTVCIYGEAYGAGIQKGGVYRPNIGFRGFDVRLINELEGRDIWLNPADAEGVIEAVGLRPAPFLSVIAHDEVPASFAELQGVTGSSVTAFEDSGNEILPEGVVARPLHTLYDNRGERLGWKLTFRDL